MNGFVVGGHAGFLHSFRESRVSVASASKVFGGSTILHSNDSLVNHLSRVRAEHVNTKKAVSLLASKDLHHAISIIYCPRTAIRHEWEDALVVLNSSFFELLLILAHRGELGMSVDDVGDGLVVDVSTEASHMLNSRNSFFFSLVGKHGTRNRISNGVDVRQVRLKMIVGLDHPTIHLDTDILKAETLEVGYASNGHQNLVCFEDFFIATLGGRDLECNSVCGKGGSENLRSKLEFHQLLLP
mmetsp:Transcript_35773/g.66190  ORF Transcript_35773/g.66190 Transcript_35773/m.66190 type:complete len:242 (+) Transcript_35773:232-957(+)